MTTYDQISTCAQANFDYWSELARGSLLRYRLHRKAGEIRDAAVSRQAFRVNMRNRRNRLFFVANRNTVRSVSA